jgi:hypothetical protein
MENQDKSKLHNQDDVNPTSQLDKIVEKKADELPETTGTGSNRPVATDESVIIKDGDDDSK